MPPKKRIRIFAGPNGSGKTTIVEQLKIKNIDLGIYVNADDIEQSLIQNHFLLLDEYKVTLTKKDVQQFFKQSKFSPIKLAYENLWQHFTVNENKIVIDSQLPINAYIAADIAELLRQTLLKCNEKFAYETVMSFSGKLDFLQLAKEAGYRIYLYYIATEDPQINVNRVMIRVAQKGHNVSPEIITSRYYRSLENLKKAVQLTDRAYIFDNSGTMNLLIAEITDGKNVEVIDPQNVPNWFIQYLVDKT